MDSPKEVGGISPWVEPERTARWLASRTVACTALRARVAPYRGRSGVQGDLNRPQGPLGLNLLCK